MTTTDLTKEERKQIAETIFKQIGGTRRLASFVGAKNFLIQDCGASFQFTARSQYNYCRIDLDRGADLYNMTFKKHHGGRIIREETIEGVFCDQLVDIFESKTELYLHF